LIGNDVGNFLRAAGRRSDWPLTSGFFLSDYAWRGGLLPNYYGQSRSSLMAGAGGGSGH